MKIQELVELAESIYPNVDLKMNNKELWSAIMEDLDQTEIPQRYKHHIRDIIWIMAKLDQDASKQQLSD